MFQGWEDYIFEPDPFKNSDAYFKADEEVCGYALDVVARMGKDMNDERLLSFSDRFWKVFLYPWVGFFLQSLWEQQVRIQKFISRHESEELVVDLVEDNLDWSFYTPIDFLRNGLYNFLYYEWIASRLIEKTAPKRWKITYRDRSREWESTFLNHPGRQPKDKKTLRQRFDSLVHIELESYSYIYGMNPLDGLAVNFLLKRYQKKESGLKSIIGVKNYQTTLRDSDFLLSPLELAKKFLPIAYGKALDEIDKVKGGYVPGRIKIGSQQLQQNVKFQLKRALAIEHGEKIIGAQHGGHGYGTSKIHGLTAEIEYGFNGFITWGWTQEGDCQGNFIPLPSPWLSKFMDRHKPRSDKIILVGNSMNPFNARFSSSPQGNGVIHYRKEKVRFIKTLSPEHRQNFHYRPFPYSAWGFEDQTYIKRIFPEIKIVAKKFHQELLNCRILVMDNPSTTLNIGMAANVPTLCFWKEDDFSFCPQARGLLDEMREVGMFFDTAISAANRLNKLGNDMQLWWEDEKVQEVRKQWIHQYGQISKTWRKEWFLGLKSIYQ